MKADLRGLGSVFAFGSLALLVGAGAAILEPELVRSMLRTQPAAAASPQAAAAAAPASAPAAPVSTVDPSATPATLSGVGAPQVIYGQGLQCAIYARQRTGVSLSGAARLWWDQAAGQYARAHTPRVGAVMAMGGTPSGHVAVVARVISAREILIDHANWMNQGEIQLGALAVDASPNNDWSQVRVWHVPSNQLGLRRYPVQGFIGPDRA